MKKRKLFLSGLAFSSMASFPLMAISCGNTEEELNKSKWEITLKDGIKKADKLATEIKKEDIIIQPELKGATAEIISATPNEKAGEIVVKFKIKKDGKETKELTDVIKGFKIKTTTKPVTPVVDEFDIEKFAAKVAVDIKDKANKEITEITKDNISTHAEVKNLEDATIKYTGITIDGETLVVKYTISKKDKTSKELTVKIIGFKAKTTTPVNPDPTKPGTGETNELTEAEKAVNAFVKDIKDKFVIKNENFKYFNEVATKINDYVFVYARKNKCIYAYKSLSAGGEKINWGNLNPDFIVAYIDDDTYSENYQLANSDKPFRNDYESDSFLKMEINKDNHAILHFKGFIYKYKGKESVVSKEECSVDLGKMLSGDELKYLDEIVNKEKEVVFSYNNIENTYLDDAEEEEIIKTVPEGYELSYFKIAKNTEVNELTIIYKVKKTGMTIESKKNLSFVLKGWKKTAKMIDEENKLRDELQKQLTTIDVKYFNEKAFQHVQNEGTINDFNGKPNFVVEGYDADKFKMELSDLDLYEFKIKVTLSAFANEEIKGEIIVNINDEFAEGINPRIFSDDEQIEYLKKELENNKIRPFYSKDKSYIERFKTEKLSKRSFFLDNLNPSVEYEYKNIRKEGNIYKIEVTARFTHWYDKPSFTMDKEIIMDKLGVEILNEKKAAEGKDPIQDKIAPEPTITNEVKAEVDWLSYPGTDNDETTAENKASSIVHEKYIKYLKNNPVHIWNEDVANEIIENRKEYKSAQLYSWDQDGSEPKYELVIFGDATWFDEGQQFAIVSDPIIEDGIIKSIKITLVSAQNANAGDFDGNLSSTRVLVADYNGSKMFEEYLLKNKLMKVPVYEKPKPTVEEPENKLAEEVTKEEIKFINIPAGWEPEIIELKINSKKDLIVVYIFKNRDNPATKTLPIRTTIKGFKKI